LAKGVWTLESLPARITLPNFAKISQLFLASSANLPEGLYILLVLIYFFFFLF